MIARRSGIAAAVLVASCLIGVGTVASRDSQDGFSPASLSVSRPGGDMPVVREVHYRMAGSIRPLLFWIGRDRVGAGHIVWRRDSNGGEAYELLIGSDPEVAPRRLNRWGYLVEEMRGPIGRVLGVMVASDEEDLRAVEASLDRPSVGLVFKAIDAVVTREASQARVALIPVEDNLSFRDVGALLPLVSQAVSLEESKRATRSPEVRSGFLAAMSEIVHASVLTLRGQAGQEEPLRRPVAYVYGDTIHELSLTAHRLVEEQTYGQALYRRVAQAKFETRSRKTGKKSAFELVYGTEGALAEIPIRIRYQPRWWLRVDLVLDDAPVSVMSHRQ